jgi:hypothetical protein
MSMLDPAARLAVLISSQMAGLRRKQSAQRPAGQAAAEAPAEEETDFAGLIAQRLRAVDPTDPRRDHKAVRIYLESVMLAQWGSGLANDPAFSVMVDEVHAQMSSDPQLAQALAQAAAVLLGHRPA